MKYIFKYAFVILSAVLSLNIVLLSTKKNSVTTIEEENIEALCNYSDDYNYECAPPDGLFGFSLVYFTDEVEIYYAEFTGSKTILNKTVQIKIGHHYKTVFSGYRCEINNEDVHECCKQSLQDVTINDHSEISFEIGIS